MSTGGFPTPSWRDPFVWDGLVDGSTCPFCKAQPQGVIVDLPAVHVAVNRAVAVKGYCCLILRRHAVEFYDIDDHTAALLMKDIQRVSRAVQDVTGAIKINYEIHGNVVPHLHVHIIPRYPGDAIETTSRAFVTLTGDVYEPGEFEAFRNWLAKALSND